jgi:hypothetical protein
MLCIRGEAEEHRSDFVAKLVDINKATSWRKHDVLGIVTLLTLH